MNGGQRGAVSKHILEPDLDLDGWWWTMVILGMVIVVLFGFFFCIGPNGWLVSRTEACSDHWRSWEMGAVLWAILFGIYYFIRFPQLQEGMHTKIICTLIFLGSIVANAFAAYYIMILKPAVWHVGAVIAGSVLFMMADYLLYRWLTNKRQRCSFFEGFLLADLPMVAGLVTLMIYLLGHPSEGKSHEYMEAFAGGAISFQLIAANVIFVLSQGGFIRWVWKGSEEKSKPRKRIKGPLEQNPWAVIALTFALVGSMLPFARAVDASWSPWLGAVGLIAIITGFKGFYTAYQHPDRVGEGPARAAMVLGVFGLAAMVFVTPQGSMFFSSAQELPAIPAEPVTERVTAVALSPDGSMVARGSDREETLKIFDARSGKLIEEMEVEGGPVLALAFSPDGKILASGGKDLTLVLWDTKDWQPRMVKNTEDQAGAPDEQAERADQEPDVLCLAFSPEGRLLAGGLSDNSIRFWDTATERRLEVTLTKHDRAVHALAFSADGKWLVSGGDDKVARWGVTKRWLVSDHHEDEESKELWDISIEDEIFHGVGRRVVKSVAITSHGETWAAGLDDGAVQVWDQTSPQSARLEGSSKEPVLALRFSDNALVLASASRNPGVTLWDMPSRSKKRFLEVHGPATVMDFSRDASALAGGSDGGALTVWWAH